jgi:hypothetical protein
MNPRFTALVLAALVAVSGCTYSRVRYRFPQQQLHPQPEVTRCLEGCRAARLKAGAQSGPQAAEAADARCLVRCPRVVADDNRSCRSPDVSPGDACFEATVRRVDGAKVAKVTGLVILYTLYAAACVLTLGKGCR